MFIFTLNTVIICQHNMQACNYFGCLRFEPLKRCVALHFLGLQLAADCVNRTHIAYIRTLLWHGIRGAALTLLLLVK